MSILAVAARVVSDANQLTLSSGVLFGFVLLACICGGAATGFFRARAVSGPRRLPEGLDGLIRLLMAALIGGAFWILSQNFYFAAARAGGAGPTTAPISEASLRPRDWAFISTIPALVGFTATFLADTAMLGLGGVASLGLSRRVFRGAAMGLLGIIIAFPLVFAVSEVTDSIFESIHYTHPQEHELLKVMDESGHGPVRIALIVGAVILAPLFEETLFRGHVQTFLREWFCRWGLSTERGSVSTAMQNPSPAPEQGGNTLPYARQRDLGWQTWLAILLTSALFALVHPAWMRPTIFFLAICLGYAYERTGSLWTNVVMHAIFNGLNTYLFLNLDH